LEEVNRQISNLREDVKTLIENQEEFQRSMMQLMGQKCSSKVGSFTGLDSRVQDFEENVTVAKTR